MGSYGTRSRGAMLTFLITLGPDNVHPCASDQIGDDIYCPLVPRPESEFFATGDCFPMRPSHENLKRTPQDTCHNYIPQVTPTALRDSLWNSGQFDPIVARPMRSGHLAHVPATRSLRMPGLYTRMQVRLVVGPCYASPAWVLATEGDREFVVLLSSYTRVYRVHANLAQYPDVHIER